MSAQTTSVADRCLSSGHDDHHLDLHRRGRQQPAVCEQDVIVTDNENPTITCAADQTQTADAGVCEAAVSVVESPATGDNCGVASVVNDYNGTSDASDTYPVGETTIIWTVTDIYGNTATCEQKITVTDDENPTIDLCESDQTHYRQ